MLLLDPYIFDIPFCYHKMVSNVQKKYVLLSNVSILNNKVIFANLHKFETFILRHTVMICRGESEFMKNYSTSMGLKTLQAFSSNVLMSLLQSFIVFTTWESLGKFKSKS